MSNPLHSFGIFGRRIEYDHNYGIDRRRGWSAVCDGCVVVQFVPFWRALWAAIAWRPSE